MQPHQWRVIGWGCYHPRTCQALAAENALDEFLHLASALTDQPNDDDIGGGIARHHAKQHAFAYTAAGEQPDSLAAADRQKAVDGANADVERLRDRLAQ